MKQLVPANQSNAVYLAAPGGNGETGDYLETLIIIPSSAAPGSVILADGDLAVTIYAGGTGQPVSPVAIRIDEASIGGPWSIKTGANVSVLALGTFSL